MKKAIKLTITILLSCSILTACGCKHAFGEATITKNPTCVAEGEMSAICELCGESKLIEKIPKIDHVFTDVITQKATCNNEGVITPTCECGITRTAITVAKTEHNYIKALVKEPTYKHDGSCEYTCDICGDKYTETIEKLYPVEIIANCVYAQDAYNDAMDDLLSAYYNYIDGYENIVVVDMARMFLNISLAYNGYVAAYNLCGDNSELSEIKSILSNIIKELEVVKDYPDVTFYNYASILKDILSNDNYKNVLEYELQLEPKWDEF